jgi:hypothetical protein
MKEYYVITSRGTYEIYADFVFETDERLIFTNSEEKEVGAFLVWEGWFEGGDNAT